VACAGGRFLPDCAGPAVREAGGGGEGAAAAGAPPPGGGAAATGSGAGASSGYSCVPFFLLPLPVPYHLVINLMLHCAMCRYSLVAFCACFFDNISLVNSVLVISTFTLLGCIHGEREKLRKDFFL
jgi:hypothetical protein